MKKLVYIHGLGSSSVSSTGLYLKETLKDYEVFLPEIPIDPIEGSNFVKEYVNEIKPDIVVGSSLGGFYTAMVRPYDGLKKILINPALNASGNIQEAIGVGFHDYLKPRSNGETSYKIDLIFLNKLRGLELMFYGLDLKDDEDYQTNTYAIFGSKDEFFNNQEMFKQYFDEKNMIVVPVTHRMAKEDLHYIVDLIRKIEKD